MSPPRSESWTPLAALLVLLLLPGWATLPVNQAMAPPQVTTTVTIGPPSTATPIPATFWGVDLVAGKTISSTFTTQLPLTPVNYIRFPGGGLGDRYNYTANVAYADNGTPSTPPLGIAQFVPGCEEIACHAILQLPAEIDDPSTAAAYVAYVEQALHFYPSYWEIGNEPENWAHFDQPWSEWANGTTGNATPETYATVLGDYITAIRAVDPATPILGLGVNDGMGLPETLAWAQTVAAADGARLGGLSVHAYVAGTARNPSPGGYYAALNGSGSLPRVAEALANTTDAACGCQLPVFFTEFNSADFSGSYAPYLTEFPNVVFVSAAIAQALDVGIASVEFFSFTTWFTANSSALNPTGVLYSTLFPYLGTSVRPVDLNSTVEGVYAAATSQGPDLALLVANTNLSANASLAISGLGGGLGTVLAWSGTSCGPIASPWNGGTVEIPPQSVVLLRTPAVTTAPASPSSCSTPTSSSSGPPTVLIVGISAAVSGVVVLCIWVARQKPGKPS